MPVAGYRVFRQIQINQYNKPGVYFLHLHEIPFQKTSVEIVIQINLAGYSPVSAGLSGEAD